MLHWGTSNEYPQHAFLQRNKKYYPRIIKILLLNKSLICTVWSGSVLNIHEQTTQTLIKQQWCTNRSCSILIAYIIFERISRHKKGPYTFYRQRRSRSLRSLIWVLFCLSTYTTVSIDSVSGWRRPRSACAYAQADLGLRCRQIA